VFKAFVLVRNLESGAEGLDFGEFKIDLVGLRFKELREVFSSVDVNQDDWIFEKSYTQLPLGPPGSPVGGIPNDIEDILFLLRLYKVGDISFIKQAIIPPSGNTLVQFPYRAMNDLNSYSPLRFEVEAEECQSWKAFADGIRESQSWSSDWFAAARRFFLCGGAKQFNPKWDDVDLIFRLRHGARINARTGKGLQYTPYKPSRRRIDRTRRSWRNGGYRQVYKEVLRDSFPDCTRQ
jgi:hypothetical protein